MDMSDTARLTPPDNGCPTSAPAARASRPVGRPRRDRVTISVTLPPALATSLRERAEAAGKSLSDTVEEIVSEKNLPS